MLYQDDEVKTSWETAKPVLQAIVQIFEGFCFEYGHEVTLIDVINPAQVLVGCPDIKLDVMTEIEGKMNQQFDRKDGFPTCMVKDADYGLFILYARFGDDYKNLH